jgi:rhodanese-related sulfurtransferase
MSRKIRRVSPKSTPKRRAVKKTTPIWEWILIGIAIIAAAVLLYDRFAPDPSQISVDQAAQAREQGAFMLDVREPDEWQDFHMPGATLIPLGDLPDRLSEVPTDREIVVVCRSGNRSQEGRDILLEAGFTNVSSMAGGMNEWRSQGLPVESGP